MSEVLQMVTRLIESSTDLGDPEMIIANPGDVEASEEKHGKRRRFVDLLMSGEGGCFANIWRPKLLKVC